MDPNKSIEIAEYGKLKNLFVLFENGKNVLHDDAIRFDLDRARKNDLIRVLRSFCKSILRDGPESAIREYSELGQLKKLDKTDRAKKFGKLWEIRSDSQAGRILIVIHENASIVVAATDKSLKSRSGQVQDHAIHRGMNRWETLLKN